MKGFKKILGFILAAIIAFGCVSAAAFAKDVTPVVMVSGFGATTLTIDGEVVFPPSVDDIKVAFDLDEITDINSFSAFIAKWRADLGVRDQLSDAVIEIMEPLRMNPDGSSCYDVKPIVSGAENTSLAAFKAAGKEASIPYTGSEFLDMESIGAKIGDENVFNFTYDWRLDYNLIADELKAYIDDVLTITDADRVSIYSVSQGSMVVGQYLYKYSQLEQTDNVIFDTPVLGGASFVCDVLGKDDISLDYDTIFALLGDILHTETDLTFLSGLLTAEIIPSAINYGRNVSIIPIVCASPAFWEMIPPERFDEISAARLDSEENAAVIEDVQAFYSGFMTNITETFETAEEYGTTVSIKACTGNNLVTNTDAWSDTIVDMKYSCGALCAPYGESFSDSYIQAVENGHNSISPDRTVDLSAGYWPHRTWVFNTLRHGQVEWCRRSLALIETLLYTDEIKDAYSSYEFPQFIESEAPTTGVAVYFEETNCCFLNTADTAAHSLVIKNTSLEKSIYITGVETENGSLSLPSFKGRLLKPQESFTLEVRAKTANAFDTVTVSYLRIGSVESSSKSFGITLTDSYSGVAVDCVAVFEKQPFAFILDIIFRVLALIFGV